MIHKFKMMEKFKSNSKFYSNNKFHINEPKILLKERIFKRKQYIFNLINYKIITIQIPKNSQYKKGK